MLFNPLEVALLDNTPTSSIALLEFYTGLLRHWTARLLATHPTPPDASLKPSIQLNKITQPLFSLSSHTSLLLLTLQAAYSSTTVTSINSSLLTHLESLTFLISHAPLYPTLAIPIPHPLTIYLLVFIPSIPTLSRLCAVLATYKLAFEATLNRPTSVVPTVSPSTASNIVRHTIAHFNSFLMDICNLLWRSRAFNISDTNALGCLLAPSLLAPLTAYVTDLAARPGPLSGLFSLSYNPALAGMSITAWREFEDKQIESGEHGRRKIKIRHAGPVNQKSLLLLGRDGGVDLGWKEYRLLILQWLTARGVSGVGELMSCTMKGLMGKEGRGGV